MLPLFQPSLVFAPFCVPHERQLGSQDRRVSASKAGSPAFRSSLGLTFPLYGRDPTTAPQKGLEDQTGQMAPPRQRKPSNCQDPSSHR